MTKAAAVLLVAILSLALAWSVLRVFDASFETGGIYPASSSLRKDPLGASVLFESLARLIPATERNYLPLERSHWAKRTLLVLAVAPPQLMPGKILDYRTIEQFARQGNRVVLALETAHIDADAFQFLEKPWGLKFERSGTPIEREVRFNPGPDWTVLPGSPDGADLIERRLGQGSLVLSTSTDMFTNGGLANSPDPLRLVSIIGEAEGVVFDEAHFGIVQSGSIMSLLRGFHLQGLLCGLLLLGALVVWKFSFSFPPAPRLSPRPRLEGRRSFSGLIALLRRNLSTADLVTACWHEWLKGATRPLLPDQRLRVEHELRNTASHPVVALRAIHEILYRRKTD